MKEGMSMLRGRKSVPRMNSSEREMERGYYSAFTLQLDNDDLKQIDADDLEEINLKMADGYADYKSKKVSLEDKNESRSQWNYFYWEAMIGAFRKKEEPTNYALMAFTSSSSSSSDNKVASYSKACTKAYATLQLESVEARILVYQQNEPVFEEDIKLLKLDVKLRDNALVDLRKKFEKAKQERDELKLKLDKFQTSSKNLSQLLASQTNYKTRLGYDTQVFNSSVFACNEMFSSESDVSMPASPVYDRYHSREGYHAILPPYTGTFMPLKPDLVFHDAPTVNEIVLTAFNVSDSKDDSEGEPMHTQITPSFVHTTKQVKTPRPSVKTVEHPIPTEHLRKDIPKSRGHINSRNRKACFVCKSLTYLIKKDCDYYKNKMVQKPIRNHAMRGNHQHYARMKNPNPQRHVVPTTVLTRSWIVPLNAARPVNTAVPQTKVTRPRPAKIIVTKPYSPLRRPINHRPSPNPSNFSQKVTTVKAPHVNAVKGVKGNWLWKPKSPILDHVSQHTSASMTLKQFDYTDALGRSKYMTGNMSYLSDFEAINGRYVGFGGNLKGGKITGKGKIRTGKLDFNDIYFVKELKFNIFSVLQMCDKKNNVLFTDTECIVLSSDFKLPNENHVLLGVPRENYTYNVDLKNIVLSGDLTCLFAKETLDESNLWHRRLGHINFKTMNKLVKGNPVRGLPSKVFKNNHTCVACKKGKQHKASYLNQFCGMKRKKREFSVARTPQQNGIAKRKNMTLIEAARTMLADSLLLIPFRLRTPSIDFMRPFGCLVTILNTLDPLGKFDGKADEGFLVGYSVSSKAFRVFNSRIRFTKETLHINFLENQPNVAGSGPTWLFDIDILTKSMNYQPVIAGNQTEPSIGIQEHFDADKAGEGNDQQYVLFPLWSFGSKDPQNTDDDTTFEVKEPEFEVQKPESAVHVSLSSSAWTKKHDDKTNKEAKGKSLVELSIGFRNLSKEFKDFSNNNINKVNAASTPVPAVGQNSTNSTNTFSAAGPSNTAVTLEDSTYSDDEEDVGAEADFSNLETTITVTTQIRSMTRMVKDQGGLTQINNEDFHTCMFACFLSQEEPKRVHQALKDPSWIEAMQEELLQFKMQKEEGINYEEVFAPVAMIEAIRLFLAYASFIGFMVYQIDVNSAFLYGTIKEEVYVCQPLGFEDPDYPDKVYKVVKALYGLHQAPRACQDIYVAEILRKFGLTDGKSDSTPIDTEKPLLKDPDGEDVDVHTYSEDGVREPSIKLTFYKAFFSVQWKFLIHTILQCMSAKRTTWNEFNSSMASAVICLATGRKFSFSKYIFDSIVRNMDSSSKFYMYSRFLQLMINAQVGDLSSYTTKYTSPALIQKVFANMRRTRKVFSGVDTPLFEGMMVPQQVNDNVADDVADNVADDVADVPAADAEPTPPSPTPTTTPPPLQQEVASTPSLSPHQSLQQQPSLPPQQKQPLQPSQTTTISMDILHTLLETCTTLTWRVENLEQDKIAQALEITKLKQRVKRLEKRNRVKVSGLKRLRKGRLEESQAQVYHIDLEHADKVLSMQDDEPESAELKDKKGVVIRDPKETATPSTIVHYEPKSKDKGKGILVEEPKPLKKKAQIEQDKAYARALEAELNKNINWDDVIEEDLEMLWQIVQERFASSKPKNFSDDFLLTALKTMFEKLDVVAQMILLVERRYPLTRFTLEQILNNVRLEVEEESEVSLELLRFVRRQQQEGYRPYFGVDVVKDFKECTLKDYYCWLKTYCCWYKLKLLDNAADSRLRLLEESAAADGKMRELH
nr:hypothetical protein [Tanacetum cinerariifolium]